MLLCACVLHNFHAVLVFFACATQPDVICQLESLTELWVDANQMCRVSLDIGHLVNLRYLDVSANYVDVIPSQIGHLNQLTDLLMGENHITELPDTIGE